MTSIKPASSKRTGLPLRSDYASSFRKDWTRLTRSGRYDLTKLKRVMLMLIAADGPLGAEWKDHSLTGEWADHRECHVGGDFLLIYRVEGETIVFVRAGTHSELFE